MISADSATFFQKFSSFWARLGSCFRDFSSFSYFLREFSGCFAVVRELFWEFQWFQLLFPWSFPDFGLGWGADLVISADSATFLEIFPAVSLG